ncbi:hypothetical protein BTE77_34390 [Ensifer adhaerens]|nr:hypothetical protein BTE77_34390 [Ensifer adhaerens]
MKPSRLPTLIQRFFTERLTEQVNASPNTIAGYRGTFRLLLTFASAQQGRPPTKLAVEDIDARLVGEFLNYVEAERGNSARSRNTRLAAIRSFFRFVAMLEPDLLRHCQKILDMPNKRYVKRSIDFLCRDRIARPQGFSRKRSPAFEVVRRKAPGQFRAELSRSRQWLIVKLVKRDPVPCNVDEERAAASQIRVHLAQRMHDDADCCVDRRVPQQSVPGAVPQGRIRQLLIVDDDRDTEIRAIAFRSKWLRDERAARV